MLWGDGSPTREFLYVDDCAEGLVLAAERYDGAEPVNLGTGVETSIRELAELVAELTGLRGRDRLGHLDAERPAAPLARRVARASELFGFRRGRRLREGLERTVAWYRAHALAGDRGCVRTAAATAAPFVALALARRAAIAAAAADGVRPGGLVAAAPEPARARAGGGRRRASARDGASEAARSGCCRRSSSCSLPAVGVALRAASYRDTYVDRVLPEAVGCRRRPLPGAACRSSRRARDPRAHADGRRVALLAGSSPAAALVHPSGARPRRIGLAYASLASGEGAVLALGRAGVVLARRVRTRARRLVGRLHAAT